MRELDPVIRRLQTGALVWCAVCAGAALAGWPDRPLIAASVVGGGVLTAVSFLAIRSSIDAFVAFVPGALGAPDRGSATAETGEAAPAAAGRGGAGRALLKLTGRYALLALLAYVMIARLRLHPVGLIVGASSLVASASLEAVRVLTRASR